MLEKLKPLVSSIYIQAIIVFGVAIYAIYSMTHTLAHDERLGIHFVHDMRWEVDMNSLAENPDEQWIIVRDNNAVMRIDVLDNPNNLSAELLAEAWIDDWIGLKDEEVSAWVQISNREQFNHALGQGYQFDALLPFHDKSWGIEHIREGKLAFIESGKGYVTVFASTPNMDRYTAREFEKIVNSIELVE